ncbi:mCG1033971, isoform CRA_a, partial [Mus musculus]
KQCQRPTGDRICFGQSVPLAEGSRVGKSCGHSLHTPTIRSIVRSLLEDANFWDYPLGIVVGPYRKFLDSFSWNVSTNNPSQT